MLIRVSNVDIGGHVPADVTGKTTCRFDVTISNVIKPELLNQAENDTIIDSESINLRKICYDNSPNLKVHCNC